MIDELLRDDGYGAHLDAREIIDLYHHRGADELIHRALKDFAGERLPFKRFSPNRAYYFVTLVAFFLYDSFKEDVCKEVVPLEAYPTTVRRRLFDQAGQIVLKVTRALWERLKLPMLWLRSYEPPPIHPVLIVDATQNRSI